MNDREIWQSIAFQASVLAEMATRMTAQDATDESVAAARDAVRHAHAQIARCFHGLQVTDFRSTRVTDDNVKDFYEHVSFEKFKSALVAKTLLEESEFVPEVVMSTEDLCDELTKKARSQ